MTKNAVPGAIWRAEAVRQLALGQVAGGSTVRILGLVSDKRKVKISRIVKTPLKNVKILK